MAVGTALAIGSALAPIAGGVIGNISSRGDREKAQQALDAAMAEIDAIGAGPDLQREIILEKFKSVGVLTPQLEKDLGDAVSQAAQVQEDPSLREAQMSALQLLKDRSETGIGPEERAAFNEMRNKVQRDVQGQRGQILQQLQQRGMGGSGAELVAQLQAAQSGANQQAEEADRLAAEASRASLSALDKYGNMSGSIRGQDNTIAQAKASAADEMSRFNLQNQIARQTRNTNSSNEAQKYNLNAAQQASDQNTAQANQELNRQRSAEAQEYANRAAQAERKANALQGKASNDQNNANSTAQMWSGIGSGVGSGLGAGANYLQNNEILKRLKDKELENSAKKLIKGNSSGSGFGNSGSIA